MIINVPHLCCQHGIVRVSCTLVFQCQFLGLYRQFDRRSAFQRLALACFQHGENAAESGDLDLGGAVVQGLHRAGKNVGVAKEGRDEFRGWAVIDQLRCADLFDPASAHDHNLVGHGQRFGLVVGDEDRGDADAVLDSFQLNPHFLAQVGVERISSVVAARWKAMFSPMVLCGNSA